MISQEDDQLNALFKDVKKNIRDNEDNISDKQLFYTNFVPLLDYYNVLNLSIYEQSNELLFDSKQFRPRDKSQNHLIDIGNFTIDVHTPLGELWRIDIEANSFKKQTL